MPTKDGKILVVDDNEDILLAARMLLGQHVAVVHTEKDPNNIPNLLRNNAYDAILLDMNFTQDVASVRRAARAIAAHGWSCLRLALRGADGSGEDFYHAGLIDDLAATVDSAAFADYERIVIIGYSLGGHLALRYACEKPDSRVRAVAAICAPLERRGVL